MTTEDLLNYFYRKDTILIDANRLAKVFKAGQLVGSKATRDIRGSGNDLIVKEGRKITKASIKQMEAAGVKEIPVALEEVLGRVSAHDVVDPKTGEVLLECNQELTTEILDRLRESGVKDVEVLVADDTHIGPSLRNTLLQDKVASPEDAILEIYKRLRPGDPPTIETATTFFNNLFFNPERYDLSRVGRLKLNHRLGLDAPLEQGTLRREDILHVVRYLIELKNGNGQTDDIDHLGNRRVRAVGELVENQYRIGLVRMERAIKERMSLQDIETLMPQELINYKPVSAVIKEFFGSSQLSQFMDQTNPLSEITHKRRLSALGPGGLTRERAGFEVRDVHPTHYGRVCPIETPEGPNIGLIASLSTFARVNEFGFVETPYREVANGRVSERVRYLSALEEEQHVIAQANAPVDERGEYTADRVSARRGGEFVMVPPEEVDFMDVSPNQLVSVAASLIPFLENDDANRALMGANMQRQAVPLLRTEAPLVGTGMEKVVARDSGVTIVSVRDGIVEAVDATRIVVRADKPSGGPRDPGVDIYNLTKYQRSNQNTCINQKPIVREGDHVNAGEVIADGSSTEMGELALGRNVLVAFMPWGGYNFEDSILLSERVVKDDFFTSVHIEEFECVARDTKLGPEEITRDIPNVGEDALKDLDESGIIRIGAEVRPGDILIGKITPKGETQLSPEEKLLRAIFGEKAGEVRDTSLKVPPGRRGHRHQCARLLAQGRVEGRAQPSDRGRRDGQAEEGSGGRAAHHPRLDPQAPQEAAGRQGSREPRQRRSAPRRSRQGQGHRGERLRRDHHRACGARSRSATPRSKKRSTRLVEAMQEQLSLIRLAFTGEARPPQGGDELPPGVIKMVKVFVAIKRKLQVGDKMAGRHGNKGVLSRILPEEDMPYLEDGTPVEVVLNPLGVPSRMNLGQILETHLGWAARALGVQLAGEAAQNGKTNARCAAQEDERSVRQGLRRVHRRPPRRGCRPLGRRSPMPACTPRRRCSTAPPKTRCSAGSRKPACRRPARRGCSTAALATRSPTR